ncbi:methionyl-tRNA formyltransferase [Ahrensia kielensis]|uniref:methionyl-tRNA formyltransferase n=1 Tax=Ahrensia kielensis TaxID=76980 RepID=UPI0003AB4887|nr:methionyl-tRNA formyltransferase [Ahrensia kielensis]
MRIIFMGTPDFSVPTLLALVEHGHEIVACYSQPPRPAGRRGLELKKSPVHETAEKLGIEVRTPTSLKSDEQAQAFSDLKADVAVVVAYGLLLPEAILSGTEYGCYNGHASLLPRWRGAAPIQRAIMAGDSHTGMMVMKMDKGLDTGDIAMGERVAIGENTTAGELHDTLSILGADLMTRAMSALERGSLRLQEQPIEGVEYAAKIDKAEAHIDFSLDAQTTHNLIRGLAPFPGAWCEMHIAGKWERVKLLRSIADTQLEIAQAKTVSDARGLAIGCASGAVIITTLQKAGSKAMAAAEFLRGAPVEGVR